MMISVIVPTYRRAEDLSRCLDGIAAQWRQPDQVVVVRRSDDDDTARLLKERLSGQVPLEDVVVEVPGQVAALNAGLKRATGEIVSFTDDDAVPLPDWLVRIEQHFAADASTGGVAGRDYVDGRAPGDRGRVGIVQWWGRCIGNHDRGRGPPRFIDIARGANMSFRRKALAGAQFDTRLRGDGAQVANDMKLSLTVRTTGWRIVYDPNVAVDHPRAERFGEDQRLTRTPAAQSDAAHNEALALLEYLPIWIIPIFVAWSVVVGTREFPGLIQFVRLRGHGYSDAWPTMLATIAGRFAGVRTWLSSR